MGEAEKDSFIALPGEGGHSRLPSTRKLCIPTWEDLMKSFMGFPGGSNDKKICLQSRRPGFSPWVGKIPWRRAEQFSSIVAWRIPGTAEARGLAVYGVTQSQPRLKRLSSSSSPGHALVLSATPPLNSCYKVKKVKALATQLCPTLCDPRGL